MRNLSKAFNMPCSTSKFGKGCDFQLRAERPDLKYGTIHVFAHSQHNHPIEPEGKKVKF
jgi:hypothetical protein